MNLEEMLKQAVLLDKRTGSDENTCWAIQDYYSSVGEFTEKDFKLIKTETDLYDYVFELIASENLLYSGDCSEHEEFFYANGYQMGVD